MSDMFSRPGNMLALAMVSVVASFLATLWFAQRKLDVVDDEIAELTLNATPSMEMASDARSQLRRVVMQAHAYVESRADRQALASEHERLVRLRDSLLVAPRFPGETVLLEQLDMALPPLGAALDAVIAAADGHDTEGAQRLLSGRMAGAVERVDAALDAIQDFNAAHARERVLAIRHTRDAANRLGSVFGLLSVVLAAVASLLVVRALRRAGRVVDERDRLLQARASEMEAFAYRVAHDLRGPLAGIALRLSAAEAEATTPDRVQCLQEKLRARVRHMSDIIEGLLEFARAGSVRKSGECSSVGHIVDSVLADVQPEAEAAGVALSSSRVPRECTVACSAGVLSSVLSNLVRNALKYVRTVERASRRVELSAQPNAGCLRICVEDNGPGIPRDAQDHIFRPFVRATGDHVAGIGLGLATVERLVTAHGGRVGVRSELGVGSLFWVELPLAPTPGGQPLIALEGGVK
jgi:signal transduction histidine kinase